MKKLYIAAALFLTALLNAQNPAEPVMSFSVPGAPAGYFNSELGQANTSPQALLQADGKIILKSPTGLERINGNVRDLTFNATFVSDFGVGNPVTETLLLADGKILVATVMGGYEGYPSKRLVRLNTDGSIDLTFDSALMEPSRMTLQPDGKILLFNSSTLMRLNSNGSVDPTFSTSTEVNAMTLLPDGKILYQKHVDFSFPVIARMNSDGTPDLTFSPGPSFNSYNDQVKVMVVQPDGKIIIAGIIASYNNVLSANIVRLNSDGTHDTTFSPTESGSLMNIQGVNDVALQPDGKILVATQGDVYTTALFGSPGSLIRLNTDGSLDTSFNSHIVGDGDGASSSTYVVLRPDGKIFVQSIVLTSADQQFDNIILLNSDGSRDTTFNNGPGFSNSVMAMALQSDNKIVVGGTFTDFNQVHQKYLVRLNEDGSHDATFNTGTGFNRLVQSVAVQGDGKILVGGPFTSFNNTTVSAIVRLNANGSLDTSFIQQTYINGPSSINAIVIQPDGKILIGGYFYISAGGIGYHNIARLNIDGSVDTSFSNAATATHVGLNGTVNAILLQPDGKIVVGGTFTGKYSCGLCSYNRIMRLNTNSTIDTSFYLYSYNNTVRTLALEADGNILVGGDFTDGTFDEKYLSRLVLYPSPGIDVLPTYVDATKVYSIVVQPDRKIIVAGQLYGADNINSSMIMRLTRQGIVDQTFNPGSGFDQPVRKLLLNNSGQLYAGGDFLHYNGNLSRRMAVLRGDDFYAINGVSKLDADNNGCDVADNGYPYLKFAVSDGTVNIPNSTGSYSFSLGAGSYTITPEFEHPAYFTASPANFSVAFPGDANPSTQNFCITPTGDHNDLEINLLPLGQAFAGGDAAYKLIYKNNGTVSQSGTVTLTYDDPTLDLASSIPAVSSQAANTLTWNFTNLAPFESREINITMNLNASVDSPPLNIGDILGYSAVVASAATDETESDNTSVLAQTVVNSVDPNDKTCLEGGEVGIQQVGEYVHYMIRFENTGTSVARNIVVRDMVDTAKYDINSLTPLTGSHLFVTRIFDGNRVEFAFENINLPFAAGTNDGFVAFKIRIKSTLNMGDSFSNGAAIYFDYNAPINTNIATTTITSLGTADFALESYISLYPNPVSDVLNIYKKQDIGISTISIYNLLGQLVMLIPDAANVSALDVSPLERGNYFMKIDSDKGISTMRFIKE